VKRLLLVAAAFFASSGTADAAGPVQMIVRNVLPAPARTLASATPRFNLVGVHWQGSGTPWFRTRGADGRWSAWQAADDDWGRVGVWRRGNAVWTGTANAIQFRKVGQVTRIREYLLWSPPVTVPQRRLQLAGSPAIVSRAGWQAVEEIRRAKPRYAPALRFALVHHTVTKNGYSCAQSAAIVRGIEVYHVKGNGWDDIGYNFLVDACGQVFEGRYGGIERNVVGAHSQGFNNGSVGVALIGDFRNKAPSQAAQDALVKLLAWRLDVGHVDPSSTVAYASGGNAKFHAGRIVDLHAISGHRDTYLTECPGNAAYRLLPAIAKRVAREGVPKLYNPVVSGTVGSRVRFTARLSTSLPWTVSVVDAKGAAVASGSGTGTAVDWTWDARTALKGRAYTWTISSIASVRPAVGVFGGSTAAFTLTGLTVTPSVLDGVAVPSATVAFTLSAAATVTADVVDSYGLVLQTLYAQSKPAGMQTIPFTPTLFADGTYSIRVTARDSLGRQAQATAPVTVSHAVLSFNANSRFVSPNGDGRHDSVVFDFMLAQPSTVTLAVANASTAFPLLSAYLSAGRQTFGFSGIASGGVAVPDGVYQAKLTVGTVTLPLPLTVDRAPPTLTLVSPSPLRLRVAEAVTVIATVNGRTIRIAAQPGVVNVPLAKGETVRTLSAVARDAAGNESAAVTYPRR
jgi:N-acetylmuramoyl-L-alanine amidase